MDNNSNAQTKACPFCAEDIKAAAIICKHCGSNLASQTEAPVFREHNFKLGRCIYCDVSSVNAMTYRAACKPAPRQVENVAKITPQITLSPPIPPTLSEPQLHCPKCKSTQLTWQKKGFGLMGAAVGGILMGGVGLLAGFVGSGNVKITCLKCGHVWKAGAH